ncbi:adenylate/guanylate cyclase domain-containing protein [Sulfuritalea sp.]|uniref:adenylate/guanylate cyclase domain-containing protein n=1 Tax=Sulfuritalea sp. TaxID=2480090 RepID=UPI001ACE8E31|nr:adenylate/guanylate cyclase domain-containing protein [Sulfuritalea sp.]MBN8475255.1 GAF domain-containing protein [Sulfuritalea sp.]
MNNPAEPIEHRKRTTAERDQEGRRRLRHLELLLEVTRRMAGYGTLDQVLQALVEMTTTELNAERGSLFLNDPDTNELYSRVAQGNIQREIRILNTSGVAGYVYTAGEALIIHDAYADDRFNRSIDEQTGFTTRNILCVPIKTVKGEIIGVAQTLNKRTGKFTRQDLNLLEAMTSQGTLALQSAQFIERMQSIRRQEMEFIDVVSEVTADIKLGSLLQKVMGEATRLLNAERSTLFLNDEKTSELWSEVGQGLESVQIRLPNHLGIAGAVFSSGKAINIPYAYADLRFNPAFDKKTGYFTRSILCVPIVNKHGKVIGVTQVLNKRGGPFTGEDESRLRAFTAQISIALENAKLFADVQNMKNYNEAMLESMSNAVITLDEAEKIATCNAAGLRILRVTPAQILQKPAVEFFAGSNAWVQEKLKRVGETQTTELAMEAELIVGEEKLSVNLTALPLLSAEKKRLGSMLMLEDISSEKRMRSTMSRLMDPGIADQMLAGGVDALGGKNVVATVLFSDIRGFTTITESLGAQGTVALLNEYFTLMVDCIQREEGMLDKFIGDAIMAAFGIPVGHDDDADRSVRTSIAMIRELWNWNKLRVNEGKLPVDIGIGLNTDNVVSGTIGSKKRMDYTIIGDGVNLAARLESACKQYGAHILISEFTYKQLRGTYYSRELDLVVVKGKTRPVAIYEVLDYHTDESYPQMTDALRHFRSGLMKYRQQKWTDARNEFGEVLALNTQDKAAKIYVERCDHFRANPPGDDWDGVWVMESK